LYRHVISLGGVCEVAHNIRRVFGIDTTHFFDWHITPFSALQPAITAQLKRVGDEMLLRKDRSSVVDGVYRIQLYHAFSRGDDALVMAKTVGREQDQVREKIRFLRKRWARTLAGGDPILFVLRHGLEGHPPVTQAQLEDLSALLAVKAVGGCHLLCLRGERATGDFVDRPGLSHDLVVDTEVWQGDPASWDRALGRFDYQPPPDPPKS
jgi:hypothetical protein